MFDRSVNLKVKSPVVIHGQGLGCALALIITTPNTCSEI